jgi:CRISPR-associated protein Cas6
MTWTENPPGPQSQDFGIVVDLLFRIHGERLPLDHAWGLYQAVCGVLLWLEQDEQSGIHQIHILESGSGWQRPAIGGWLHLSKRTRLILRVPLERIENARVLSQTTLNFLDCSLHVGDATVRNLSPVTTLYARHVISSTTVENEDAFLDSILELLRGQAFGPVSLLCGQQRHISTPDGPIQTRSLMISELSPVKSLTLQQKGIGPGRKLGCGLFVPHKGIASLNDSDDT